MNKRRTRLIGGRLHGATVDHTPADYIITGWEPDPLDDPIPDDARHLIARPTSRA